MATKRKGSSLHLVPVFASLVALTAAVPALAAPSSNASAAAWVATATHAHELRASSVVRGLAAATEPVHIVVSLQLRNRALLDDFVANQRNPTHLFYRQNLTPADIDAVFSPTADQVQAVVNHLQANGFANINVSASHMLVSADGAAANVQAAFATRLVDLTTAEGERAYANVDDAMVPAALSDTVLEVIGLQTESHAHSMAVKGPRPAKGKPGGGGGSTGTVIGHNPKDFASIYNASGVPTASNVTVGIIAQGNIDPTITDLNKFTSTNGLPTVNASVVYVQTKSSDTSGQSEWNLDSQDIVGISGGVSSLIFYTASTLSDANLTPTYDAAVTADAAKVINISLGECETSAPRATDDAIFARAMAQGQTFSASSGDSGANECGGHSGTTPSYPASSPNLVAVGGTTLGTSGTGNTTWAGEAVWSGTGGSPSKVEPKPSWQTTVSGSFRGVPDLAFDADPNSGAIIYVKGALQQWGGTSLSSPLFVGSWARMLAGKSTLGFAAPHLYATALNGDYHDVTSGSNGGETAATGWDYTTGFGSFILSSVYPDL